MYAIGALYPTKADGSPNLVLSSSYRLEEIDGQFFVVRSSDVESGGQLNTTLRISTDPVVISGLSDFINNWLKPQLTDLVNPGSLGGSIAQIYSNPYYHSNSKGEGSGFLWNAGQNVPRATTLKTLVDLGYRGEFKDFATINDGGYWSGRFGVAPDGGTQSAEDAALDARVIESVINLENYETVAFWDAYSGSDQIHSDYEIATLLGNLYGENENYWYPSLIYTYAVDGEETSMPGPVLFIEPGDTLNLNFKNDIRIPGLSDAELEKVGFVPNSSPGSSASDGLGGTTSTNTHAHGAHVNSVGFGDNVVSRYTTGQEWTTTMEFIPEHARGAYWYHPHYHPSVNQQVYGGLSGFLQIGDSLSQIPGFEDVPRNLAQIKQFGVNVDPDSGNLNLESWAAMPNANQLTVSTVNGEFQPTVNAGEGGWQSLSISNQANQAFYNLCLLHTDLDGNVTRLPIYIYGEDGHQYPQIRRAEGVLAQLVDQSLTGDGASIAAVEGSGSETSTPNATALPPVVGNGSENIQLNDFLSLAPGKRVEILVYLPEGTTELASYYAFGDTKGALYSANNMGIYPDLSSYNINATSGSSIPVADRTSLNTSSGFSVSGFSVENQSDLSALSGGGGGGNGGGGNGGGGNGGGGNGGGQAGGRSNIHDDLGPGPLAVFHVSAGSSLPQYTLEELNQQINEANERINVQYLTPDTKASDYDVSAIPSVDLFAKDSDGNEVWTPLRNRQFDWSRATLVGPYEEYDAMTKQKIDEYNNSEQGRKNKFERYGNLLPLIGHTKFFDDWGGYDKPFMINDHVFPNGPLTIAQLGTIEEWRLRNWSVVKGAKYTGHPFHIHVNDYQVKDSDTELGDKRNLEDVTMLNSSGYEYYDTTAGAVISQEPFRGEFHGIDAALDPEQVDNLGTFGANDQTIRMVFQDYIGSYVFHCHILPHEDAGMMQVISIVENTDASWLLSAEGFEQTDGVVKVYQAQDYSSRDLDVGTSSQQEIVRSSVGDLTSDFKQDILFSIANKNGSGEVRIFDGDSLLDRRSANQLSSLTPYSSGHAPWAFAEDFDGDGGRDIVTAGFDQDQANSFELAELSLAELSVKFWLSQSDGEDWEQVFDFTPFADGVVLNGQSAHLVRPLNDLQESQIGVAMADMNLDNFQDVVISYAIEDGFRVIIYDGAALSLSYSTGLDEGGYFPNQNILADAVFQDESLGVVDSIALTSGFNDFYQAPLENLLVTTESQRGFNQYTFQLNAGHFIATAVDKTLSRDSKDSGMHSDSTHAAGHSDSAHSEAGHAGHGMVMPEDSRVTNIQNSVVPIFLTGESSLLDSGNTPTPFIAGVLGNGVLVQDGTLAIAQGNGVNGLGSTSQDLFNTSQQVYLSLDGLLTANQDDLTGAVDSRFGEVTAFDFSEYQGIVRESFDEVLNPSQFDERNNLASLAYRAYTGCILDPSALSSLAGGVLGQGHSASDLVEALTITPRYSKKVKEFFEGAIEEQSVKKIANKVTSTLFGREASKDELSEWSAAVDNGVSKTELPMLILRSASGDDVYRLAALSASMAWNVAQWATSANIDGSFSQGFQPANEQFDALKESIGAIASLDSWDQAQDALNAFTQQGLNELLGSPLELTGMF